jgi:hypothetical protein
MDVLAALFPTKTLTSDKHGYRSQPDVRFIPKSGHVRCKKGCPLWANRIAGNYSTAKRQDIGSALENAPANGLGDRVTVACMNLLAALPPLPLFDVILSSPPKHAGEPRDLADRGWHAGPHYRDVAALFEQARERLKPDGCLYVMLSSDSDLDLLGRLINKAGFRTRLAYERSFYIESMILYELRI